MTYPHLAYLMLPFVLMASDAQASSVAPENPGGWNAVLSIAQNFTYDTNPLRLTSGEDSIFGSTTSPKLFLRNRTPLSLVESESRMDANVFDDSDYNSTDFHQSLLLSRSNQRWTANLKALASYDTTRVSELTSFSVNIPKVRSLEFGLAPEIYFKNSERSRWGISAGFNNVTYDNTAFVDYNLYRIAPSYEHRFDARNSMTFALNGQRYETRDGLDQASDSYGPSVGWTHEINPRFMLRASAGAMATNKHGAGVTGERNSWNYVFSGTATYKGEQDTFDFTLARAREPFGNGTETLLNTISFNERHKLNQHLALKAEGKYQSADYESIPGINLDYSYQMGGGLAYSLTPRAELNADYRYRNETLTTISNTIDQHVVMLGVNYTPDWLGN